MHRKSSTAGSGHRRTQLIGAALAAIIMSGATAQSELLSIEFNQDDQPEFDLWPGGIAGSFMTAQFGQIQVDLSTNTAFAQPANRGNLMNGTPAGFTYKGLYEDLLHASSPTGTLTIDVSGLNPNQLYTFTLYAWDPGFAQTGTHEWSVTGGTGVPAVQSVDWSVPLTDNETFALVFDITTDASGAFQVDNTNGLQGSAVNGFKLFGSLNVGTNYCMANPNSTGSTGSMSATGTLIAASNDLTVQTSDLPNASFGFFIASQAAGFVMNPAGSEGNLCLGGAIGRYVGPGQVMNTFNSGGFSLSLDLTMMPQPNGFVPALPGQTWNFQAWHRDVVGGTTTSNFTDGLRVLFQ